MILLEIFKTKSIMAVVEKKFFDENFKQYSREGWEYIGPVQNKEGKIYIRRKEMVLR